MPKPKPRSSPERPGGAERRSHPRVTANWPVTLALPEGDVPARLRDISAAGLSFFLDRPVPEMTVLALDLAYGKQRLRARGAVVRCEKLSPHIEHYEVALFLHEIAEGDRRTIEDYVRSMSTPGAARTRSAG